MSTAASERSGAVAEPLDPRLIESLDRFRGEVKVYGSRSWVGSDGFLAVLLHSDPQWEPWGEVPESAVRLLTPEQQPDRVLTVSPEALREWTEGVEIWARDVECPDCIGGRHDCGCGHEHDCGYCEGTGMVERWPSARYGRINGGIVNRVLVARILGSVELVRPTRIECFVDERDSSAQRYRFSFEGGAAVVMGMKDHGWPPPEEIVELVAEED